MSAGGLTGSDGRSPGAFTGRDGGVTSELTESGALGSSEAEGASTEPALTDGTAIDGVLRGTPVEGMVTGNEGVSTGTLTGSEGAAGGDTTLEGTPEGVLTIGAPLAGRLTGALTGMLFRGIPTDGGVIVGIVTGRLNGVVTGKPERALVGRSVEGVLTGRLTGDTPTGVLIDDVGTSLARSEEAGRLMSTGRKIMVSPTNG